MFEQLRAGNISELHTAKDHTPSMERVDWGGAFFGAIRLKALNSKEKRFVTKSLMLGGIVGLIAMLTRFQDQVQSATMQAAEVFASESNDVFLTPDPGGFAHGESAVFIDTTLGDPTDDCRYPLLLDATNVTDEPVEAVLGIHDNGVVEVSKTLVFEPGDSEERICVESDNGGIADVLHVSQSDGNGGKMMERDFPLGEALEKVLSTK